MWLLNKSSESPYIYDGIIGNIMIPKEYKMGNFQFACISLKASELPTPDK